MSASGTDAHSSLDEAAHLQVSNRLFQTDLKSTSDVRTLFGMPLQIPARKVSRTGKKCVDAGLRLRWIEDKHGLAAFLLHRVVGGDRDSSERLAISRYSITEYAVVRGVCKRGHAQQ